MSSVKEDGGPAFPFAATDHSNEQMQAQGMTLRDYFAAHCPLPTPETFTFAEEAAFRYKYADAMIAERSK